MVAQFCELPLSHAKATRIAKVASNTLSVLCGRHIYTPDDFAKGLNRRKGLTKVHATVILVLLVAILGLSLYASSTALHPSSSILTSSADSLGLVLSPNAPVIAPGLSETYALLRVELTGPSGSGNVTLKAHTPQGLSFILSQNSISLQDLQQPITTIMTAAPNLSPGQYQLTIQAQAGEAIANQSFSVMVVPALVVMLHEEFMPANLTIQRGTAVTWLNLDSNIGCCDPGYHLVVFTSGANASSAVLKRLEQWSYNFNGQPGEYDYYCSIHPSMRGTIRVTSPT